MNDQTIPSTSSWPSAVYSARGSVTFAGTDG